METNDVETLGSRAPDATVILLITESTHMASVRADHRAVDSSHLTGGLRMCGHTVDKETGMMV